MCGINAIFSKRDRITEEDLIRFEFLFASTEERGTDAAGLCWDNGHEIRYYKGNLQATDLLRKIKEGNIITKDTIGKWAFGHARWATDGTPDNNKNNHPVISRDKRVALVHNGILSMNRLENYKYKGEVDTEVLVSYIATNGIKEALKKVRGSAAIICFYDDTYNPEYSENRLYLWKHSSPAVVCETDTAYFVGSTATLLASAVGTAGKKEMTHLTEHMLYELTAEGLTPIELISPDYSSYTTGYGVTGHDYDDTEYWDSFIQRTTPVSDSIITDTGTSQDIIPVRTEEPKTCVGLPFRWYKKPNGEWAVIPRDIPKNVLALPSKNKHVSIVDDIDATLFVGDDSIVIPNEVNEIVELSDLSQTEVDDRFRKLREYIMSGDHSFIDYCKDCESCPCMTCDNAECMGPAYPLYPYCLATKCKDYMTGKCRAPIKAFPTHVKIDIARIREGI